MERQFNGRARAISMAFDLNQVPLKINEILAGQKLKKTSFLAR